MMNGLTMMLKSFGFDADEIIKIAQNMGETLVAFKAQMDQIEENQRLIMEHLQIERLENGRNSGTDYQRQIGSESRHDENSTD